ncbi:MAG: glycerate kinase [Nitrososphaerota archaeon]
MINIQNFNSLVKNATSPLTAEARRTALTLVEAAVSSVDPKYLVQKRVQLVGHELKIDGLRIDLADYRRVIVVGAGKASGAMAEALEYILGSYIETGLVNVPKGTAGKHRTRNIKLHEAGHPTPDEKGMEGAEKIAMLLENLTPQTLVISLLSGGGSALLPLPKTGISLSDKKVTTNILMRSGATIEEINTVRKHLSALKGGQLATRAYPATLISLILSDVVGDPLQSIASGPTVPDPTTFRDAVEILQRYNIWDQIPDAVRKTLRDGLQGGIPETPKPSDARIANVHNVLLGNNRVALDAASDKASSLNLSPLILSSFLEGEARHVGTVFAGLAREMQTSGSHISKYDVILAGGETTVTVTGKGRGGRNQELVLSASVRLKGLDGIALASVGTDGVDGLSNAAGAIVDGYTINRAYELKINPFTYLANNDSNTFFSMLGDEIITGPTGTNVNDILIMVNLKK